MSSNDCSFEIDDLGRICEGGNINIGLSGFEVISNKRSADQTGDTDERVKVDGLTGKVTEGL